MTKQLNLPISVRDLIPHRRPMRLIDNLLAAGENEGLIEAKVPIKGLMVDAQGLLADVALAEMMAQGFAAFRGYENILAGTPTSMGFLVGIRNMQIFNQAFSGEHLHIRLKTVAIVDQFAVSEGTVTTAAGNRLLAKGSIKLWIPPAEEFTT